MFNPANLKTVMQSPLHHFGLNEQAVAVDDSKGVWANELPLLGYISVRGNPQNQAFTEAFKRATNVLLPTQPCQLEYTSWCSIIWQSPDEWLLICKRSLHAEVLKNLETAMTGIHAQVLDNSGGYTAVALHGKNATETLQHCTVYDLGSLEPGRVVGSTFGKSSFILHRLDTGYFLIFRRSFADYIWRYLERSASPYGFGISKLNKDLFI